MLATIGAYMMGASIVALRLQRPDFTEEGRAGARRSLGRRDARVVDVLAAAGLQLRGNPVVTGRDAFWIEKYGAHGELAHGPAESGEHAHADASEHGRGRTRTFTFPVRRCCRLSWPSALFAMFLG